MRRTGFTPKLRGRMLRSVILKISAIVFITGILVNILVFYGLRTLVMSPPGRDDFVERNVNFYLESLAREIGSPPNIETAKAVAKRTGLGIRLDNKNGLLFTSESDLPQPNPDEPSKIFRPPPMPRSIFFELMRPPPPPHKRERHWYRIALETTQFSFFAPKRIQVTPRYDFLPTLLVLVTFLLGTSAVAIHYLLRPINELAKGASALGDGNIAHRVSVKSKDEFGRLAQSFNDMASRLQAMIESKERLLIDVSHELRSPIARMKVAVELLQDTRNKPRIARDVNEMEKMVQELLDTARSNNTAAQLNLEETNLTALIQALVLIYAEQKPGLVFSPPKEPIMATVDLSRFTTVLRNLIENALKYSDPDHQKVVITIEDSHQETSIKVQDFGIGIPADEIPHLFEPFYRVDKSRNKKTGGYGLGLNLCKNIITSHGGTIALTSQGINEGTCVIITLPKTIALIRAS